MERIEITGEEQMLGQRAMQKDAATFDRAAQKARDNDPTSYAARHAAWKADRVRSALTAFLTILLDSDVELPEAS